MSLDIALSALTQLTWLQRPFPFFLCTLIWSCLYHGLSCWSLKQCLLCLHAYNLFPLWNVLAVVDPNRLASVSNLSLCSDTVKLNIVGQFFLCVYVNWLRASSESRSEKERVRILSHYTQSCCKTKLARLLQQQPSETSDGPCIHRSHL